jgi:protein phosphatase 2C family protein 2/3
VDGEGYLNGTLGVSRALGDWQHVCPRAGTPLKAHCAAAAAAAVGDDATADAAAAPSPLSADADVTEHELTEEDEFLLLACDGLWDVVSSPNAVQIARQQLQRHNDPAQLAADLAHEAIHVRHSGDNVTVVAVCLSAAPPPVRLTAGGGLPARNGSRLFARSMSQEVLAGLQRALDSDECIAA